MHQFRLLLPLLPCFLLPRFLQLLPLLPYCLSLLLFLSLLTLLLIQWLLFRRPIRSPQSLR